jgi:hypothetical protein
MPDRCTQEYERALASMGSLAAYGRAAALMAEFLPLDKAAAIETTRRRTLGHVASLADMLHADPTTIVNMTHANLPVEARPMATKGKGQQICRSCFDRNSQSGASGAILKNWMEAWRVTCRLCGSAFCEINETRGGWDTLRETSAFADLQREMRLLLTEEIAPNSATNFPENCS